MILRDYQIKALEAIWTALQCEQSVLLEAACSAGKTLLFSKITQRLLAENPGFRVLILMDREILVSQTREKLLHAAPELALSIGTVCASVSSNKVLHKPVTIASRQSLVNQLNEFEPVQLIIVDECHLMAMPKESQTEHSDQFGRIISTLREYNPKTRLLGVTASPYRLVDGYIYGKKNVQNARPYFNDVHHRITVGELLKEGFLAPLVGKTIVSDGLSERLKDVSIVAGEYNLGAISRIMSEGVHIKSAVEAWKEYASGRKKTLAFGVTIEHAEKLATAFNSAGIPALAVHSELDDLEGYAAMKSLKSGEHRVFCSVGKLTTGLDVPDVDCILMARPTKSTALYKQILGRGMRIAPGKKDCLVLDMVGNNHEFGTDLDRLTVRYRQRTGPKGQPLTKTCPNCETELHPAVRVCPDCGYEYPAKDFSEVERPDMVDVEYGGTPPETLQVIGIYPSLHVSKQSGKKLLRIRIEFKGLLYRPVSASLWLCFIGDGYEGYAVEKGKKLWKTITGGDINYPYTVEEAMSRESEIGTPQTCLVDFNGKYPEIKEVGEVLPF